MNAAAFSIRSTPGRRREVEVPEALENGRNVFQRQRNHGIDRHADGDLGQRRVHVPFPREDDPVEVPGASGIDAEQKQAAGVGEEAGEKSHRA